MHPDPGIGIRIVENGKTIDYVICYSCLNLRIYHDGEYHDSKTTTREPAAVMFEYLDKAEITK